jgi:hypothetical protein
MALSFRRPVVLAVMIVVVITVAMTYRGGYVTPVTLFAENAPPAYPQPAVADTIHVLDAAAGDGAATLRITNTGTNIPVGWAKDGSLLYVSDRIGRSAIFAQAPGASSARLLADYDGMTGHARMTPDGSSVLFKVGPSLLSQSQKIMRVAVEGGDAAEVVSGNFLDGGARCAVAPAMLCAVAERHDNGEHVIFSALNPISGRGRELARVDADDFADLRWDLSPDGTRIAVADAKGADVRIVMIGGPAAERITVSGAQGVRHVSFTSDSRGVIVPAVQDDGISLISIALQGSAELLWEQPGAADVAGMPSPDGQHVAVWVRTHAAPAATLP